jgi:hypothetical protein
VVNENILMALRQVSWNPTSFCIVALARYMTRQCGAVFLVKAGSRLAITTSHKQVLVEIHCFVFYFYFYLRCSAVHSLLEHQW